MAAFKHALLAINRARGTYLRLNSLTAVDPAYAEPQRFARSLAETVFQDRELWPDEAIATFFRWAVRQTPVCKLLLVLATLDALDRGESRRAADLAARALTLVQNNLHIQALYRRALGYDRSEADLLGRFCPAPFENIETAPGGEVYFCCPAWQPVPIGRLDQGSVDDIWNSSVAQEIRRSIHDGDYRYCSRSHCPHLSRRHLPKVDEVRNERLNAIIRDRTTRMPSGPTKVILSHDRSCNLSCPSCRTRTIVARKDEQERLNRMAEQVILPIVKDALRLHVTASGDPFGSAHFRYILRRLTRAEFPRLRIDLQTNGILCDAAAWNELDLAGKIDKVAISMDAATEATYRIVRRGGSFSRLLRNLDFLAGLRCAGQIKLLRLDFVVQSLNFREMPAMIEIARRFHVDRIKFQMIRNWNTYTPTEFAGHNIGSPDNPRYAEFMAILCDPRLSGDQIEFWGMEETIRKARALGATIGTLARN